MNRRSFFGLALGAAAIVPFARVPAVDASAKPVEWRYNLGVGVWASSDGRYVTDEMIENTRGQRDAADLFFNAPHFEWPQVYPCRRHRRRLDQFAGALMGAVVKVYVFPNGMVAATDADGHQVPEYQGRIEDAIPLLQRDFPELGIKLPLQYDNIAMRWRSGSDAI